MAVTIREATSAAEKLRALEIFNTVRPYDAVTPEDVARFEARAEAALDFLASPEERSTRPAPHSRSTTVAESSLRTSPRTTTRASPSHAGAASSSNSGTSGWSSTSQRRRPPPACRTA
jgi:hypothetical protein